MTDAIDLTKDQRKQLTALLRRFLPGVAVWAYGSRVKWTARPNSDLDLVAFATPAQQPQIAELKAALAESNLPFPVDLHVWDDVPERFRQIIRKDYVVVQEAKEPSKKLGVMGEWEETTLADVSSDVSYGYTESASEEKVGPHFLRITDIQNGIVNWGKVPYCPISAENHQKYCLQEGDIVVARTGNSTGENFLYQGGEDAVYASYLIRFRIARQKADPKFIWYNLRSQAWWNFINNSKTGSAQAGANAKILGLFPVNLPPLNEQYAIARILGTLDDKIELNRRMNETLEAMARALFKSWFVDFDPVRAKAEGRDPGIPKTLADLFPASFEDSELEEIPRGWEVTNWGELISLEYGKSLRQYDGSHMAYPVYGTNGPIGSHSESLCDHAGIIIGRKGAYRGVHFCSTPFFVIDTAFYVEPREPIDLRWAYYELLRQDINSMDSGSAIPSTSRGDFYNVGVLSPPLRVQETFAELLKPFWARQEHNNRESSSLSVLRDTLLPKLISGELRVKDAERLIERGCKPSAQHPDSSMV